MICKANEASREADKMIFIIPHVQFRNHAHNFVSFAIVAEEIIKLRIANTKTLFVIPVARKAICEKYVTVYQLPLKFQ